MEENIRHEEQPQNINSTIDSVMPQAEENVNGSSNEILQEGDDKSKGEAERGVPAGKFKSVDDLVTAYQNLQAEFTRKSQRLAEMEKEKMQSEPSDTSFDDKLKAFLSKNQEAVLYAEELKSRINQNESLKNDENCFDKVWSQMLFEKLSSPNRAKEPLVKDMILKDKDLKNLIIEDYMKQLQEQKTPIVMSSNSGERVTKPVAPKPDSFEQAKKIVLDLLS